MATASFTVTIEDAEAPVITVPADIAVNADAGLATAVVSYTVSAIDNVDGVVTPELEPGGLASGSAFPAGATTVTHSASDAAGNIAHKSFTVTVIPTVTDHVPPVVTVPGNVTVVNDPGFNSAVVTYAQPTAVDDVDGPLTPSLTAGLASGSSFPLG